MIFFGDCSDREYQRGDEVAWYPDGDTMVRHEYNPLTAYAFGILMNFFIVEMTSIISASAPFS